MVRFLVRQREDWISVANRDTLSLDHIEGENSINRQMNGGFTPPQPQNLNSCTIALKLLGVIATALVLAACPSPGGGGGTTTYTTTVTGTITASAPGEPSSIDLPGAMVSAVTTPADPANQPVTSGPDGGFTLQFKHSGSFRLKVNNTCSEPFTTAAVTASADGTHNAGALRLTLKPEPTGIARYSFTPRTAGGFKLTVNNCVREIGNNEFGATGTIITAAAAAESVANSARMITEIALPSTLRSIGENGLERHELMSGTLAIPRNVETIAKEGVQRLGFSNTTAPPTVVFETGSKLTTIGDRGFMQSRLKDFTLPENLETIDATTFYASGFSFSTNFSPSGTLIIPAKVSKLGSYVFGDISGITVVDIRSDRLAKPSGATTNFPLADGLFQNVTVMPSIKLPAEVYDSYDKVQLQTIFGSAFTDYRRPDGTAYDFAAKS